MNQRNYKQRWPRCEEHGIYLEKKDSKFFVINHNNKKIESNTFEIFYCPIGDKYSNGPRVIQPTTLLDKIEYFCETGKIDFKNMPLIDAITGENIKDVPPKVSLDELKDQYARFVTKDKKASRNNIEFWGSIDEFKEKYRK